MIKEFLKLPWHTTLLIFIVGIWGIYSYVGIGFVLYTAPPLVNLSLFEYYLFFSSPTLMLLSGILLYKRSKKTIIPFALLPFSFYFTAFNLYPEQLSLSFNYRPFDINYFSGIPLTFRIPMIFFFLCCVYYFFLRKHGLLNNA